MHKVGLGAALWWEGRDDRGRSGQLGGRVYQFIIDFLSLQCNALYYNDTMKKYRYECDAITNCIEFVRYSYSQAWGWGFKLVIDI